MGHLIIPQTGVQLFRGEVFLTSAAFLSTTNGAAITLNVAVQSILVASSTGFAVGDVVGIDTGANFESVTITAIADATHISGIFTKNHVITSTITRSYQNVPLGLAQEVDFDDTIDLKELRGPRSRMPVAVAQSGAKVAGSCKFASTNPQILAVLRGATLSTATIGGATVTKASRKGSDNVKPVLIELFDVDNESGAHALFYNVVFTDLKNPQKLDDYTIWDATFNCYPETVTGSIYDLFYPGDQTQAYVLPTGYTLDTGLSGALTDYASTQASVSHFE